MADVFLKGKFHSLTSENRHVTYRHTCSVRVFFVWLLTAKAQVALYEVSILVKFKVNQKMFYNMKNPLCFYATRQLYLLVSGLYVLTLLSEMFIVITSLDLTSPKIGNMNFACSHKCHYTWYIHGKIWGKSLIFIKTSPFYCDAHDLTCAEDWM